MANDRNNEFKMNVHSAEVRAVPRAILFLFSLFIILSQKSVLRSKSVTLAHA